MFKRLTVQDGLTRNWVKCIFQDKFGYLWVGTANGLNRYDGISFRTYKYNFNQKYSINNNDILLIYEDKKGNLWIGTQAGLNLYDREKDGFISMPNPISYVKSIYEYDDGRFLIGSPGGLYIFNPKDYSSKQLRYDLNILEILCDKNKNFWVATFHGLKLLDTTDYSHNDIILDKNPNMLVWSLFEDSKGGIWAGTNSNGLFYLRNNKNNPRFPHITNYKSDLSKKESLYKGAIYDITEDDKGVLWIGIENGGINLLNLGTFSGKEASFQHIEYNQYDPDGLSDNSIHHLYRDKQNTIWVGTYSDGVNYHNTLIQKFNHFKHIPGNNKTLNNNRVNSIYEEDKYIWFGTEGGLNFYDKHKQSFSYYTHSSNNPNTIGSNAVWPVFRDSRNNIWVGTWSGGLNFFNQQAKTFKRFMTDANNPNSIGGNNIYSIIETRDGSLWIASMLGGLNKYNYNTQTFKRYKVDYNKNSISGDWVMDLLESHNGNLWISTTVAVDILDMKTGHFTSFKHNPNNPKSISYNGAIVLFEDSKHNIWIGTSNGLNLFNHSDSSFRHFYASDGLPSSLVCSIEEDNHGNLWLGTNNGISKFVDAINLPKKPLFVNYNQSDGLQGNEFNSRSSFKNKDGLLYFGGNNGYNVFNPDKIKNNPYLPNIVFTKLLLFNKPVGIDEKGSPLVKDISTTRELKLKHKENVFTIEFASLNLLAPEKNQYAFMLEGFEKQWNFVGKQHLATYTNLNPGRYTFRVKASNNDGLWNEKGISLDIVIIPAWWQTWLAKIIYFLLLLLAIYFFRKHTIISVNLKNKLWREHLEKEKIDELNQLKNQFFTNVSHELRSPLTLILGPLKKHMAEKKDNTSLVTIYQNASRLKTLVNQIMDISKIESNAIELNLSHGDIVNHILSCTSNFLEFAKQKNISLSFKSTISTCLCLFDPDKIEKILSNIISNALKNTPEGESIVISLDFKNSTEILIIECTDTGRGISPAMIGHIFDRFYSYSKQSDEYTGTGIGLDLTKKLVELHKGSISVSSIPGKGATFTIQIPMPNSKVEVATVEKFLTQTIQEQEILKNEPVPVRFNHDKQILIIDDNVEMCNFIESILSEQYDVIKEVDPTKAFKQISNHMPDLIISDVMMPGIDGFELVKQIRNDLRYSHIPIILLTAKVTANDHITGYETGADDYIYKPFDGEILKARIKNLIVQKENLRKHLIGTDGIINPKIKANNLDIRFIENILELIKSNFSDPEFNVNDIIVKTGMSRSIFYKKYKALSDQPINDLIKDYRLKKAVTLLLSGQYSISQAAYECGFSDPAYFSKVFKEYYKMSPKEYMANNNGLKI